MPQGIIKTNGIGHVTKIDIGQEESVIVMRLNDFQSINITVEMTLHQAAALRREINEFLGQAIIELNA